LYVCLFHAFRFNFSQYLSLLIVSFLLLHSYPFLTWPHFSCPSVLSLIPFDPHLLSPIFVLTLFDVITSLASVCWWKIRVRYCPAIRESVTDKSGARAYGEWVTWPRY
jgi:hypothetical protein